MKTIILISILCSLLSFYSLGQKATIYLKNKTTKSGAIKKVETSFVQLKTDSAISSNKIDSVYIGKSLYIEKECAIDNSGQSVLIKYIYKNNFSLIKLLGKEQYGLLEGSQLTMIHTRSEKIGKPVCFYNPVIFEKLYPYLEAGQYFSLKSWTTQDLIEITKLINEVKHLTQSTIPAFFHKSFYPNRTDQTSITNQTNGHTKIKRYYTRLGKVGSYDAYWRVKRRDISIIQKRRMILVSETGKVKKTTPWYFHFKLANLLDKEEMPKQKGIYSISRYSFREETMRAFVEDLGTGEKNIGYPNNVSAYVGFSFRPAHLSGYFQEEENLLLNTPTPFIDCGIGYYLNFSNSINVGLSYSKIKGMSISPYSPTHRAIENYSYNSVYDLNIFSIPIYWQYRKFSRKDVLLPTFKFGLSLNNWTGTYNSFHVYQDANTTYINKEESLSHNLGTTDFENTALVTPLFAFGAYKELSNSLSIEGNVTTSIDNNSGFNIGFTLALNFINKSK